MREANDAASKRVQISATYSTSPIHLPKDSVPFSSRLGSSIIPSPSLPPCLPPSIRPPPLGYIHRPDSSILVVCTTGLELVRSDGDGDVYLCRSRPLQSRTCHPRQRANKHKLSPSGVSCGERHAGLTRSDGSTARPQLFAAPNLLRQRFGSLLALPPFVGRPRSTRIVPFCCRTVWSPSGVQYCGLYQPPLVDRRRRRSSGRLHK
ncbi:hypothetical protein Mp_3g04960 [Marchantia polymorpha subsp. ruderalis]|uniref:Uncharacterized protein n=2 Tax=Marchantia polymorpha TaxID=3197 RepID=A0AAF6AXJ2_MARPO|nr:hypothetical protein MARPO_0022s0033 [Marchantia polymorpha]BBN04476.1 hypothetical protein Mp_3g04960 [Marchantia polymorpha subsp. ruderalis]|eukprot:PTQ43926.1 hypothetical protein MARPO_0022s0033 [Marchantia polymorpha]